MTVLSLLSPALPSNPPVMPSDVKNKASACPSSPPSGELGRAGQHSSAFWSELVMGNVYQQSSPPITGLRLIVSLHFKRPFGSARGGVNFACRAAYLLAAHLHMPAAAAAAVDSYFQCMQKTQILDLINVCCQAERSRNFFIYKSMFISRCTRWRPDAEWQATPLPKNTKCEQKRALLSALAACSYTTLSAFLFPPLHVISSFLFALWLNILLACMISFNFDFLFFFNPPSSSFSSSRSASSAVSISSPFLQFFNLKWQTACSSWLLSQRTGIGKWWFWTALR